MALVARQVKSLRTPGLVYFLSKKDLAEGNLSPIRKLLMKMEHEQQAACGETFFYTIYGFIFHTIIVYKNSLDRCIFHHLYLLLQLIL
jgi:hypothetical protein